MRQKVAAVLMMMTLLLSSCAAGKNNLQDALTFREKLLESGSCCFTAKITAEVQERGYVFLLESACREETASVRVLAPESIADISAQITSMDATISFDGVGLTFGTMDDVMTSPLYLPWLLHACWRDAYIDCVGEDGEYCRVTYRYGTGEEELILETWFSELTPIRAEVYRKERLLLSAKLEGFTFGT